MHTKIYHQFWKETTCNWNDAKPFVKKNKWQVWRLLKVKDDKLVDKIDNAYH